MLKMNKNGIIKRLKSMNGISKHWSVKDFLIIEDDSEIKFCYIHGDYGLIEKITYNKKDGFTCIYELNNYYGDTYLYQSLYI